MAEQQTYNYTLEDIQRYLNGGMNAKQMHELERAALQDPFLADAIDGYANADRQQAYDDLNNINAALQSDKEEARIVMMPSAKFAWLKIAAVILFVVSAGAISLLLLNKTNDEKPLAKNEAVVAPQQDSAKAGIMENKAANDNTEKSFGLTEKNIAKPKQELKKTTEQLDTVRFYMKSSRSKAYNESAPLALNRKMNTENEIEKIKPANDSDIAPEGRAAGLSIPDSSLKNAEASAVSKGFFQNNKSNSIQTRGYNIKLDSAKKNPNYMAMSELEVTKLQSKKSAKNVFVKDSSSAPVGGWPSFQEYVYNKLKKPYDSTATGFSSREMDLEFLIDEDGLPYDIIILKANDYSKASEAIDAIKQGPRWTTLNKEKKVNITVKY